MKNENSGVFKTKLTHYMKTAVSAIAGTAAWVVLYYALSFCMALLRNALGINEDSSAALIFTAEMFSSLIFHGIPAFAGVTAANLLASYSKNGKKTGLYATGIIIVATTVLAAVADMMNKGFRGVVAGYAAASIICIVYIRVKGKEK